MSPVSTPAPPAAPVAPPQGRPVLPLLEDLASCCVPLSSALLPLEGAVPLATAFSALGDPVRLRVVSLLMTAPGGAVCACDLVEPVGKSQPTVSHHLKVLYETGVLEREKRATWVYYRLPDDRLPSIRQALT
jgi:ArsR family transcriptional regulator, arsenate/arsenite/antimonite-responsive transcriptional repressor